MAPPKNSARLQRSVPILAALALFLVTGCPAEFADPERVYAAPLDSDAPVREDQVHIPKTLGVIDTPRVDVNGTPLGVTCDTCHGDNPTEDWVPEPGGPEEFHGTIEVEHGDLECNACHLEEDSTLLHLADGTHVFLEDTIVLCAQCHGPQYRDFLAGSHGGMAGYWDTRRGVRTRNHCVDCHAPHEPAVEHFVPARVGRRHP